MVIKFPSGINKVVLNLNLNLTLHGLAHFIGNYDL